MIHLYDSRVHQEKNIVSLPLEFLLAQKLRLEMSGRPFRLKSELAKIAKNGGNFLKFSLVIRKISSRS